MAKNIALQINIYSSTSILKITVNHLGLFVFRSYVQRRLLHFIAAVLCQTC